MWNFFKFPKIFQVQFECWNLLEIDEKSLPEGHFVWATLENPRRWVRCPSVRSDFWTVSSINSRLWDNIFDRYNQGIRDHLKSVDCQLLSFIGYSAQHATYQKHIFSTKSPRLENGRSLRNLRFLDAFCKCVFSFVSTFSSVDHTKWPSGHPCPAGVI